MFRHSLVYILEISIITTNRNRNSTCYPRPKLFRPKSPLLLCVTLKNILINEVCQKSQLTPCLFSEFKNRYLRSKSKLLD